jgi:SagB-type dehydrogenase family enzyme
MKKRECRLAAGWCFTLVIILCLGGLVTASAMDEKKVVELPKPVLKGTTSLEEAVARRASVRDFTAKPLAPQEISQLLWAAQGITRNWGGRAAPSAGALYPLETYLVTAEGLFHYLPARHQLLRLTDHNLMKDLCHAALGQACTRESEKYGQRAERYVAMEAGHAAQNVLLQATALGLGAVPVGAFHDDRVQKALGLPDSHRPLYLIPVGHPR